MSCIDWTKDHTTVPKWDNTSSASHFQRFAPASHTLPARSWDSQFLLLRSPTSL